jgi:hypothetical protein
MKLATAILKKLLLPKLEKDSKFEVSKITESFLESFAKSFCDFEKDTESVYQILYLLELNDTEKINSKLAIIYTAFIKELAENYVLGNSSEVIDYLVDSNNNTFKKEVEFFTNLKNAITKIERKRIKEELPTAFDKLTFEISDNEIELAIRKKERESLKEKMKVWDSELSSSDEKPVYTIDNKPKSRVISLSWIQYAAAACVILAVGVFFFKQSSITNSNLIQPTDNSVVSVPVKEKMGNIEIPSEALAEVAIVTKNATIIESGMGYASGSNKVKVIEHNQKERKLSIEKAIEKYRLMLEKEFPDNKVSNVSRAKIIQDKITSLNKELVELRDKEQHYKFDGKTLVLYVSDSATENAIVFYEDTYYLRRESTFYKLTIAKSSQLYEREDDSKVINMLDQIYNGY